MNVELVICLSNLMKSKENRVIVRLDIFYACEDVTFK